jgi:hypothetical protein
MIVAVGQNRGAVLGFALVEAVIGDLLGRSERIILGGAGRR